MKNHIKIVTLLLFVSLSGCNKDDNPVEPGSSDNNSITIWYGSKDYPADSLKSWGLGKTQESYYHNDKDYYWYIDQATTGSASGNNCGPSSVTMAIKWYDKNFSKSAADARDMYPNNGGWWYTNNITDYLNHYSIPNSTVQFTGSAQLEDIIKNGSIVILCINTDYLRMNSSSTQRVDRFYSYSSGHFIVVKGARTVDNEMYFETYDPNNWYQKYSDNSMKGENRHYRSEDLSASIKNWWNYLIVIQKNQLGKKYIDNSVDTKSIPVAWGR